MILPAQKSSNLEPGPKPSARRSAIAGRLERDLSFLAVFI